MRIILVVLAVASCAPGIYRAPRREANYYSINADGSRSEKYSRINQWSTYGAGGLGAQSAIAAAYEDAQHAPAPSNPVEIFNAALPPGVTLDHGTVKIDKAAPYEAVGRYEIGYWKGTAPRETQIEEDLHRLAAVAHADTIVVEVQHFDHADDRVEYMVGIVLRKRARAAAAPPATQARSEARLVYQASGGGCMTQDELADEVSSRLGYSPWRSNATTTLRAQIAHGDGSYHATIWMPGAEPKQLTGATCKTVLDAVVTVLVIHLDGAKPPRFD